MDSRRPSRSPSDGETHAGEGSWWPGEQRLVFPAQEAVEEGEQIRTLGRECRGALDVANLSSDPLPCRRVCPDQRGGEEDKIAEREMASTFDVDGVARPAQPTPETRTVWVG